MTTAADPEDVSAPRVIFDGTEAALDRIVRAAAREMADQRITANVVDRDRPTPDG